MHDSDTAPSAIFFFIQFGQRDCISSENGNKLYKLFNCLCVLCIQILKEISLLGGYTEYSNLFLISICGNFFLCII